MQWGDFFLINAFIHFTSQHQPHVSQWRLTQILLPFSPLLLWEGGAPSPCISSNIKSLWTRCLLSHWGQTMGMGSTGRQKMQGQSWGDFLFWYLFGVLFASYTCIGISFRLGNLSSMILLKYFLGLWAGTLFLPLFLWFLGLVFFTAPQISWMFCVRTF